MSDRQTAEALLEAARRDFRALCGMQDSATFADEIFGFHAQQAVEKILKCELALLSMRYPLAHDLQLLVDLLATTGRSTADLSEMIELNNFAVEYRYGPVVEDDEPIDRSYWTSKIEQLLAVAERSLRNRGQETTDKPGSIEFE